MLNFRVESALNLDDILIIYDIFQRSHSQEIADPAKYIFSSLWRCKSLA